ncbi:MAG: peptidoglycan DD-metalloendopeptidase family protein [Actinobacteria bacterium]|nr:peptidoglycan DD-metalloendopeptidase family protein [Actinomycetota bacterium]
MRWLFIIAVPVLLASFAAMTTAAIAREWIRPVDGPVVRPFSVGADRYAAGQHRGVDLAAAPGSRVRAACGGRVSFAGRVPGGGRTVSMRCGSLVATYQHLGSVAVERGQVVMPGGRIGRSGEARPAPHVHLGARVAATGEYRDPVELFAGGPGGPIAPVPVLRRAPPPGPAPGGRPLGAAPAPVRARAPLALPVAPRAAPAAMPLPHAVSDRLPLPVWLGLALVVLGLPLGGGVVAARRRALRGVAHSPDMVVGPRAADAAR